MINIVVSCIDAFITTVFLIIKLGYNRENKIYIVLLWLIQSIIAF